MGNSLSRGISSVGSGISHGLGDVMSGVGHLFSGSPAGSQAAQAHTPANPSISAAMPDLSSLGKGAPTPFSIPSAPPTGVSSALEGLNLPNIRSAGVELPKSGGGFMGALGQALGDPKTLGAAIPLVGMALQQGQNAKSLKAFKSLEEQQMHDAQNQRAEAEAARQGILPAGAQQALQRNLASERAAIQAKYAEMGMSGSTAEGQDLQAANDKTMIEQYQMGQQAWKDSLTAATQGDASATNLLQYIKESEAAQGSELDTALQNFIIQFTNPTGAVTGG